VHEPVSTHFGLDRGRPVDRFYIERFLEQNKDLIRGRVLEVQERTYTDWFGTAVDQSDVLHAGPGNPEATLVGDLTTGDGIPQDAYDCIILTQTLPFIYDVHAAVRGTRAALKPGGTILATVPGISQISREDMRDWGDWWRFTSASAKRLFEHEYGAEKRLDRERTALEKAREKVEEAERRVHEAELDSHAARRALDEI